MGTHKETPYYLGVMLPAATARRMERLRQRARHPNGSRLKMHELGTELIELALWEWEQRLAMGDPDAPKPKLHLAGEALIEKPRT